MNTDDAVPWVAAVARIPMDRAPRLVLNHLIGRADHRGRIRADLGDVAAACCLPVTTVWDALAFLASLGLAGHDPDNHRRLVLIGAGVHR